MKTLTVLPKLKQLRQLAIDIRNFPISGLGVVQYAEHTGYPKDVIDFLRLFSNRMIFNSRNDLLEHCRLLERILLEESQEPFEQSLSAED